MFEKLSAQIFCSKIARAQRPQSIQKQTLKMFSQFFFSDLDECAVFGDLALCGANSTCINTEGGNDCQCYVGFYSPLETHTDCTGQ